MIIRKADERGHNNISWLDSYHTFSFGNYYDPRWTHFHKLLVVNDDTIAPGMGFGSHPHQDMEIITYVTNGQLQHRDSMGSLGIINPGEIQVMTAGTGVTHSEFNASEETPVHLFQIWILPREKGLTPRYDQRRVFGPLEMNFMKLIASSHASDDSIIKLNADAQIWTGRYDQKKIFSFQPDLYDNFWLQMVAGSMEIDGKTYTVGDAVGISAKGKVDITINENGAEFLIFEVDTMN
jgi:redox-sensitive bicupin YhaK (pirin superfamily)